MTNNEAIEIITKEIKCVNRECDIEKSCGKCDLMIPTKEPILKAYEMAIKALSQEPCPYSTKDGYCQYDDIAETIPTEQEPILDKIRAEIEQLTTYEDIWLEYKGHTKTICKSEVLEIIDKYR